MKAAFLRFSLPVGILLAFFVFFFVMVGFAARSRAQAATAEAALVSANAPTAALAKTQADLTAALTHIEEINAEYEALQKTRQTELAALQRKYDDEVLALKAQRADDLWRYARDMGYLIEALREPK